MLKRLIEVALPLKDVSEQSAREKSIRRGHISTLHIWWARRPLAACRAAVFASLIPDPDDPECPEDFRRLVREVLGRSEFRPRTEENGRPVEDTPRNRCLEFIKHLVRWQNSSNPEYIAPARKLIAAAHRFLHPGAEGDAPRVLDPFAGGGAIPLLALRLGCEAHAIDLNPVAHLIELCTLVYPQKYGQPDSRHVPVYIKRLVAYNQGKQKDKIGASLFDKAGDDLSVEDVEIIPDVEITEAEYRKNPLAADVKYWGQWVLEKVRREIGRLYSHGSDGSVPIAYLWARTVKCPNPICRSTIPLVRQLWLCNKQKRRIALRMQTNQELKECTFEVVEGDCIDFDPSEGTIARGDAKCPFCQNIARVGYIREEGKSRRMGEQMLAVVTISNGGAVKHYCRATQDDESIFRAATDNLDKLKDRFGEDIIPHEAISRNAPRRVSPPLYGLDRFSDLFNHNHPLQG